MGHMAGSNITPIYAFGHDQLAGIFNAARSGIILGHFRSNRAPYDLAFPAYSQQIPPGNYAFLVTPHAHNYLCRTAANRHRTVGSIGNSPGIPTKLTPRVFGGDRVYRGTSHFVA